MADVLVLDASPLDDIANVRRIAYVISRGSVWTPADLVAQANRAGR
jgi:imidazolonepropionase-like amidohydrolase